MYLNVTYLVLYVLYVLPKISITDCINMEVKKVINKLSSDLKRE